ncbi:MAG: hypothetical protein KJ905_02910 [Nanoarchaeota archaeon]|nr:hypothetical protein [Nanoarchaeota archaeon]MBU1252553.1 hypothetical protein [Nanoarchaeota archaeon]MBU1501700.1 hypothetical protein [Nanoarchaeota archaeon]MBU2459028.1 hypothetical protein [Nanoarchaeota archaeon]
MAEITISIPRELEEEIRGLSKLRFSLIIAKMVRPELERLARLKRIVSKSEFTEKDVQELSDKTDMALSQKFMQSLGK